MHPQPGDSRRVSRDRGWQRGLGLAALVSGLWLATADVHAQSLGELAARERARRAAIASPSRVYTNRPRTDQDAASTPAPVTPAVATKAPVNNRDCRATVPPIVSVTPMVVAQAPTVVSSRPSVISAAPAVVSGVPAVERGTAVGPCRRQPA